MKEPSEVLKTIAIHHFLSYEIVVELVFKKINKIRPHPYP